jgi:hypothetical protein
MGKREPDIGTGAHLTPSINHLERDTRKWGPGLIIDEPDDPSPVTRRKNMETTLESADNTADDEYCST